MTDIYQRKDVNCRLVYLTNLTKIVNMLKFIQKTNKNQT